MPDYKVEMKSAIYKDSIDAGQVQNFNEMMNLLQDKTPEEYIKDIDKKLTEAYRLQEGQNSVYEDSVRRIEAEYKSRNTDSSSGMKDRANYLGAPANEMYFYLETMDLYEELWEDKFKVKGNDIPNGGLKKVWEGIQTDMAKAKENGEFGYYNSTETYKSLSLEQKKIVDTYSEYAAEINKFRTNKDEGIKQKLSAVEGYITEYQFYKAQHKQLKEDALNENPEKEKLDDLSAVISSLNKKKEDMQNFMDGQYQQMQAVNKDDLSEVSKKNALGMLAEARREYKNNCNWWDRIWANILPSYMFSKSAYVDKINAYKEVLKEGGFSEKEIENADPAKSKDYVYSKSQGKYMKIAKPETKTVEEIVPDKEEESVNMSLESSNKSFDFGSGIKVPDTVNESIVPAKNKEDVQKNLHHDLGEATGNIKTDPKDLSKPKINSPQIQQEFEKK